MLGGEVRSKPGFESLASRIFIEKRLVEPCDAVKPLLRKVVFDREFHRRRCVQHAPSRTQDRYWKGPSAADAVRSSTVTPQRGHPYFDKGEGALGPTTKRAEERCKAPRSNCDGPGSCHTSDERLLLAPYASRRRLEIARNRIGYLSGCVQPPNRLD